MGEITIRQRQAQIRLMQVEVLPPRIFFFPHWKYLYAFRAFHLHVPTGYMSLMFTHLPSRTVFIDNDRYQSEEWLGHWIAHELGHLATNSTKEARGFRRRLKDPRNKNRTKPEVHKNLVRNRRASKPIPYVFRLSWLAKSPSDFKISRITGSRRHMDEFWLAV